MPDAHHAQSVNVFFFFFSPGRTQLSAAVREKKFQEILSNLLGFHKRVTEIWISGSFARFAEHRKTRSSCDEALKHFLDAIATPIYKHVIVIENCARGKIMSTTMEEMRSELFTRDDATTPTSLIVPCGRFLETFQVKINRYNNEEI